LSDWEKTWSRKSFSKRVMSNNTCFETLSRTFSALFAFAHLAKDLVTFAPLRTPMYSPVSSNCFISSWYTG
jgi:hypothetical protein